MMMMGNSCGKSIRHLIKDDDDHADDRHRVSWSVMTTERQGRGRHIQIKNEALPT